MTNYFWCDSSIVCCWIKTPALQFKQFVRNRVKEIQTLTQSNEWFHCPGKSNPADLISRGSSIVSLKNSQLWWKGPDWLQQPAENWPEQKLTKASDEEEYRNKIVVTECVVAGDPKLLNLYNYSELIKVIRITAWIMRFRNSARKMRPESDTLTASELQDAENLLIRLVQTEFYQPELQALQNIKSVSVSSTIYKLSPFLDDKGLLRIKGRLEESDYTFDEKKPIIVPRNAKFAELLVKQEHEKMLHSGVDSTLVQIRKKFWIPKGRQLVKKIISQCLICRRYAAKPADQLTAQIPRDRISETPPFTACGLDFTGPVYVKDDNNVVKSYIVLFTCAVTRAVHLELVTDMSTSKFLLAFRRFLSRKGVTCHTIYSDNAKTFKSADRELRRLLNIVENSEFKNFLASKKISWKFIMEYAPWWGGFYERLMRSIKEPLKKILGKALLNYEEMSTVLTEIETVLNLRPLTYVSNEAGEPEPLTPAHFLQFGRESFEYPTHFIETLHKTSTKESLTRRKEYQANLLGQLWKKWKEKYLFNLRSAHSLKTPTPRQDLKKDDIVLIEGTSKSKFMWDLGIIENVFQGRDGLVRSCNVRTSKGQYKRPVQLLYPLELYEHS